MAILRKPIPKKLPEGWEDVSDGEVDSNTIRQPIPPPEPDEQVKSNKVKKPIPTVESNEIRQPIPSPVTSEPLRKPMPKSEESTPVVSEPVRKPIPVPEESPVSTTKTKAGDYPVFAKGGAKSKSFNTAFAEASDRGDSTFEWEGRQYTTKKKGNPVRRIGVSRSSYKPIV